MKPARSATCVPPPTALEMRKEIERFKREGPRPIVYDPTDADELAEATAAAEPSKLPVK